ncbi:MAG: hypothetical protein WDN49_23900 [Acetobacteraceae bacterium]
MLTVSLAASAQQQTMKVGLILPLTGPTTWAGVPASIAGRMAAR